MSGVRHRAFGLEIEARFPLPGLRAVCSAGPADLVLEVVSGAEVQRRWSGASGPPLWSTTFADGTPFRIEAGHLGDRLMTYGDRASFHLSLISRGLACAPADPHELAWQRELLDTVLVCTSSLRGFELLHASAVEYPDGVVAFVAVTGGGKTTIAAELLRRGHALFADDIVALGRRGRRVFAHPGPALMNLPLCHPAAQEVATPIATFGRDEEAWVSVEVSAEAPAPLAAIFLLDRRPGSPMKIDRLAANPLHLMPHSVGLTRGKSRKRARFEVFADVAAQTPLYRLRADTAVDSGTLATLVESSLAGVAERVGAV